jgi:hypothetical protein
MIYTDRIIITDVHHVKRLLEYSRDEADKKVIEKEISELKMTLELIYTIRAIIRRICNVSNGNNYNRNTAKHMQNITHNQKY